MRSHCAGFRDPIAVSTASGSAPASQVPTGRGVGRGGQGPDPCRGAAASLCGLGKDLGPLPDADSPADVGATAALSLALDPEGLAGSSPLHGRRAA
ncbi:hypothetical protein ACIQVA_37460 [Streptomyces microflavus]|uniref:hypothetical protein n=1 Tax=Streptomyces microflavus TaxID=1919 RepID=UPI0038246FB0